MNPTDGDVIARLDRLTQIHPNAAALDRALGRTKTALAEIRRRKGAPGRRTPWVFAATLSAAFCVAGFALWSADPFRPGLAFADVVEKISQIQTASFTLIVKTAGSSPVSMKNFYRSPGRYRMEESDGRFFIADLASGVQINVNTADKKALVFTDLPIHSEADFLFQSLERYRRASNAKRLPAKTLDGKPAEGFELVIEYDRRLTAWVDRKTGLPLRLEIESLDDPKAPKRLEIYTDFAFNLPLDAKLFDMTPPTGYELERQSFGPPLTKSGAAASPGLLTLGFGIDGATFGMGKEDVLRVLGEPDGVDAKTRGIEFLFYSSRGFTIGVVVRPDGPRRGIFQIACFTQPMAAFKLRDFKGKTERGVGMGATIEEVVKIYGAPTSRNVRGAMTDVTYAALGASFTFQNDRLAVIYSTKPLSTAGR